MCGQGLDYLTKKTSAANDLFFHTWNALPWYFLFSLSLSFFYSVYILLSSMNIVALDDLHGEF